MRFPQSILKKNENQKLCILENRTVKIDAKVSIQEYSPRRLKLNMICIKYLSAKEYERLKLSLWKKFEYNRDAYTESKGEFIKKYLFYKL